MATIIDNDAPSGTPVMAIGDRMVDEMAGSGDVRGDARPSEHRDGDGQLRDCGWDRRDCDYSAVSGTLAFAPGETVKTVNVPITNDAAAEGDERFDLVLSRRSGRRCRIRGERRLSVPATRRRSPRRSSRADNLMVGEADGYAEFVVRLSAPSNNTVTVSVQRQQR